MSRARSFEPSVPGAGILIAEAALPGDADLAEIREVLTALQAMG